MNDESIRALLNTLDDPALILERKQVQLANEPARSLLGQGIEGGDVRLAVRHPEAVEFILEGKEGEIEVAGIGALGRPWRLSVRKIWDGARLVRLIDRSDSYAAEKIRVDFVANASHELRTPLTAILGYAESLDDPDLDPELTHKFATTIRSEARRMLRIIEDLMSLSRIEADRFVAPTDRVSITSILKSSVELVRRSAKEQGCDVHLDIQDDLPLVAGDIPQLSQMIDNLLSNAIRYGCTEKRCKVRISVSADADFIRLEVSDNGPGIPREHLPFVTRRFYRVDAARSRQTGGTGLGLAIVKHIVERHRGTLSIDSNLGKGTTIVVRLPAR
ncbi:MAG TPA: ATP-binding protein [Sphingomicrobium sp.]|nr:ATP-binding protein [Sphingomicrobium sp.]